MHTQKITATFGDKSLGRKRLLNALAITSAILFCAVTLTGCFKTETEKAEAKCQSGDAVSQDGSGQCGGRKQEKP